MPQGTAAMSDDSRSFQWLQGSIRPHSLARPRGRITWGLGPYSPRGTPPRLPSFCVREGHMSLPVTLRRAHNEAQHSGPGRSPCPILQTQEPSAGSPAPAVIQSPLHPPQHDALFWTGMAVRAAIYLRSGREPRKLQQCLFSECLEN